MLPTDNSYRVLRALRDKSQISPAVFFKDRRTSVAFAFSDGDGKIGYGSETSRQSIQIVVSWLFPNGPGRCVPIIGLAKMNRLSDGSTISYMPTELQLPPKPAESGSSQIS
jgi:hypothetical protein